MNYSIEFEMLKALMNKFNFQSNLIKPSKRSNGELINGTWSGTTGLVFNLVSFSTNN